MAQNNLAEILGQENALMDGVLASQEAFRVAVNEKDWANLEKIMGEINSLASQFSALDAERDAIFAKGQKFTQEENDLISELHSKLLKSKIQNKALNTYIETTQKFVRGILDCAVPQRRNVLYSREGKIVKNDPESVVVNRVL